MATRVTQTALEVLSNDGNPNVRVTQTALEALVTGSIANAMVTQVALEVLERLGVPPPEVVPFSDAGWTNPPPAYLQPPQRRPELTSFSDQDLRDFFRPPLPEFGWFMPLAEPIPPPTIHASAIPSLFWTYLPPVSGCIELEVTEYFFPQAFLVPQMPIAFISPDRYNTSVPGCASTQQSPGTQPQHSSS
jgi:hypothetical protein